MVVLRHRNKYEEKNKNNTNINDLINNNNDNIEQIVYVNVGSRDTRVVVHEYESGVVEIKQIISLPCMFPLIFFIYKYKYKYILHSSFLLFFIN